MRFQVLQSFRGANTPAVLAQIARVDRASGSVFQAATVDANRRVVDLAELPAAWGVWTARELLMSWDAKASGRTTHAYDHSGGPDLLPVALRAFKQYRATPTLHSLPARALWRDAYRLARGVAA